MSDATCSHPGAELTLGSAGHVDHGKTALVRALTGVDTDRLPEEKRRGITIELGFAPLELGEGLRLGVVDVPGHERFVRTMVAGASGIDLVLLVVAADEGVMPQTREHLAIAGLLGLARGVVALTKCDLVAEDLLELAEAEALELVAASALAGAPLVRVSARTGAGLPALRAALRGAARAAQAQARREGPPRLAVDRVFEARGFGCVVTGTLQGSPLAVGDAVELLPGGRPARVRGLQHFGVSAERVGPGARCAVNLHGVALGEVARGQVLAAAGALAATPSFDAELRWLAEAPLLEKPASVELLAGTSERRARLVPLGAGPLAPGAVGFARLHVEGDPLPLLPGDRFVVRGFARTAQGASTLGGGRVLDVAPPRRRRSDPALARSLAVLAAGDAVESVALRVEREGFAGMQGGALRCQTGLAEERLAECLAEALRAGRLVAVPGGAWLGAAALAELERRVLAALRDFHAREPLRRGMPRAALRGALPANAAPGAVEAALLRSVAAGQAVAQAETLALVGHAPQLSAEQESFAARIRAEAAAAGLAPPTAREWGERLGLGPAGLRDLLAYLEREGALVRAPGELFFDRGAVDALRERVVAHLREHGPLDTSRYKELIGTTRRHAVPLMELFDAEHLTLRRGEQRVLRRGA